MWSSPPFLGRRPKAVAGPSACGPSVTNFCDPTSLFTICRAQVGPGFLFFIHLFGVRVLFHTLTGKRTEGEKSTQYSECHRHVT